MNRADPGARGLLVDCFVTRRDASAEEETKSNEEVSRGIAEMKHPRRRKPATGCFGGVWITLWVAARSGWVALTSTGLE